MHDNDPLWRLRHALAGLALALLASMPLAAWLGAAIADAIADRYALRVAVYFGLLLHVLVGAVVLFFQVARHEHRPLTARRFALWLASVWLWPLLIRRRR